MPNHVHGILVIADTTNTRISGMVGATHASPLQNGPSCPSPGPKRGSLGAIVGAFKSAAAKRINAMCGTPGMSLWQRNYYEHIIRTEDELTQIRAYISENPLSWELDENHPNRPSAPDRDQTSKL